MTKIPNLQFYFTKFPIQLPGVLFEKFQNDPWCENKKISLWIDFIEHKLYINILLH
jgi:hypothetical protein